MTIPNEVKGNIGLVITGFIYVPTDGAYGFVLTSDDGSLLSIDGQVVVDNDGEHSTLQRSAQVAENNSNVRNKKCYMGEERPYHGA